MKKNFIYNYQKFILKSSLVYYVVNISISFLLALLIAFIFRLGTKDTIFLIAIVCLMTPVGIFFVGGYSKIKQQFKEKHKLSDKDFG